MSIGDFVEKAKEFAGDNPEQAAELLDKAAEIIKERTPDSVDDKIDEGVAKAKDFLDKQ